MKTEYSLLLRPHSNSRYFSEQARLARNELSLMLSKLSRGHVIKTLNDYNMLEFEVDEPFDRKSIDLLSTHSLFYILFEKLNGSYMPIANSFSPYLGNDLSYILKYKGKTNEAFTLMLINMARFSTDFFAEERLNILDPMCARGTALFQAANLGFDVFGTDIVKQDISELDKYFKKYLEFHRYKHSFEKKSYPVGKKPVMVSEYTFANDAQVYKAGNVHMLKSAVCDCGDIRYVFPKTKFHILTADLPYGIQHSAGTERFDMLLKRVLPSWKSVMAKGGALALSFNTYTLKTETVKELLDKAGFTVMDGKDYDTNLHRVEQAINRDLVVALNK